MEVDFLCSKCGQEGPHILVYNNDTLIRSECQNCGWEVNFCEESLLTIYAKDVVKRILTKPKRMNSELKLDLKHAMQTLPIRIASKPHRIVKEVQELVEDEAEQKKKKKK